MAQPGRVPVTVVLFYDGLTPPECLHKNSLNLPNFARGQPRKDSSESTVYDNFTLMSQYSAPVLKAATDDVKVTNFDLRRRPEVTKDRDTLVIFSFDGFESDIFTQAGLSALLPNRSRTVLPSGLFVGCAQSERIIKAEIKGSQNRRDAVRYDNYAMYGTTRNAKRPPEKYDLPESSIIDLTGELKF
ncbi:hypothetical protein H4582DRAFT_2057619 [Lactarius indigo]|nr:hypothetical protein H4582DRAFT_2057619 [Lactarius indigo]